MSRRWLAALGIRDAQALVFRLSHRLNLPRLPYLLPSLTRFPRDVATRFCDPTRPAACPQGYLTAHTVHPVVLPLASCLITADSHYRS